MSGNKFDELKGKGLRMCVVAHNKMERIHDDDEEDLKGKKTHTHTRTHKNRKK